MGLEYNDAIRFAKGAVLIVFQEPPLGEPTREEQETVHRMVREGLSHVTSGIPLVSCLSPRDGILEIHCITETIPEAVRRTPDLLSAHLPTIPENPGRSIYCYRP